MNDYKNEAIPDVEGQAVFFYYKDMDVAAEFYGEKLGFEKTFDKGWVKIYQTSATSFIGLVDEEHGTLKGAENKPVMFSIVTKEVDKWYAFVKEKGIEIKDELGDASSVPIRGFMIEDPEGYVIEFFQWK